MNTIQNGQKSYVIRFFHEIPENFLIFQQKHQLHAVPVYEISYEIGDDDGRFWVFGNENSVSEELKGVVVVFLDASRHFSWSFSASARPITPKKS